MQRIVITGLGAITPIGNDPCTFLTNLVAGKSGAGLLTDPELDGVPVHIACQVKDFDPTTFVSRKLANRTARSSQFALAATHQALTDAEFEVDSNNAERVGVIVNTGGGGVGEIDPHARKMLKHGSRAIGPFFVPRLMPNAVSCLVSIETGARGPAMTSTAACASGSYAILEAYHFLQRGEADVIISGGTESLFAPVVLAGFANMGALSSYSGDPQKASRPFDAERDGFVFGEGAAVMVLETEAHALERGAHIYAEILGGRLTSDAYHVTAPDPSGDGAVRAMRGALESAGVKPEDVDVIFAHGTSTPLNDKTETRAIRVAFGRHADHLAVTATKSMVGHTLGAAGAISALAAVHTLREGIIPPTINYNTPDPDCDLDYVPNIARQQAVQVAMVNAFGFGGQNVALLLGRYDEARVRN